MGSVLETGDGDQSYSIFFAFVWYVLQWPRSAYSRINTVVICYHDIKFKPLAFKRVTVFSETPPLPNAWHFNSMECPLDSDETSILNFCPICVTLLSF